MECQIFMAKTIRSKRLEDSESDSEVNLVTTSRELDSIFLSEYPFPFFPDKQYEAKEVEGGKGFIFYSLKWGELKPFIERYSSHSYLILNAKTGEVLRANKV